MESREIKSRSTFSIETDDLFCTEAPGTRGLRPLASRGFRAETKSSVSALAELFFIIIAQTEMMF